MLDGIVSEMPSQELMGVSCIMSLNACLDVSEKHTVVMGDRNRIVVRSEVRKRREYTNGTVLVLYRVPSRRRADDP